MFNKKFQLNFNNFLSNEKISKDMSDSKPGIEYFGENNRCIWHCESEILKPEIIERLLQILEKIPIFEQKSIPDIYYSHFKRMFIKIINIILEKVIDNEYWLTPQMVYNCMKIIKEKGFNCTNFLVQRLAMFSTITHDNISDELWWNEIDEVDRGEIVRYLSDVPKCKIRRIYYRMSNVEIDKYTEHAILDKEVKSWMIDLQKEKFPIPITMHTFSNWPYENSNHEFSAID